MSEGLHTSVCMCVSTCVHGCEHVALYTRQAKLLDFLESYQLWMEWIASMSLNPPAA